MARGRKALTNGLPGHAGESANDGVASATRTGNAQHEAERRINDEAERKAWSLEPFAPVFATIAP
jgi:hypothetical protein